jgi:hypothetical protein
MNGEINSRSLRILLKQRGTGLYLQDSGGWGLPRRSARDFNGCVPALSFVKNMELGCADILMAGADETADLVLARV